MTVTQDTPLRLAVFDLDGTLVDSQYVIHAAMRGAWEAAGRTDAPGMDAVRAVVGLPLIEAIAEMLPTEDGAEHGRLAEAYKTIFHELRMRPDHSEPLFPGAIEALETLEDAGILLGIATGKGRRGLDATLERHGLRDRFITRQTSDAGPGKPAPDMLHRAMAETGVEPWNTVMIGDTTFDILMAGNARVAAVGVGWGYHDVAALRKAGARVVIDAFADLVPALDAHVWAA